MAAKKPVEKEKEVAVEKPAAVQEKAEQSKQAESDFSNHPKMAKFKKQGSAHT